MGIAAGLTEYSASEVTTHYGAIQLLLLDAVMHVTPLPPKCDILAFVIHYIS